MRSMLAIAALVTASAAINIATVSTELSSVVLMSLMFAFTAVAGKDNATNNAQMTPLNLSAFCVREKYMVRRIFAD